MQAMLYSNKNLSLAEMESTQDSPGKDADTWKKYSAFHDSFAELLSYENNRKCGSDIWQLNYI